MSVSWNWTFFEKTSFFSFRIYKWPKLCCFVRYLIDVEGMRPDDAIELFNRCRGHCLERQNYIEDLQNGPIRKNWNSSVPRSSFEDSAHLMQPVHTMNKPVKRGPRYNLHQIQGHSTPRHFHTQTQNLQQSVRKFSQNPHVYQRGHLPPPGPPGEDCSRRRYSWNVKPNASLAAQDRRRWYPDNYSGLSYPAYWEWTQWYKPVLEFYLETRAGLNITGVTLISSGLIRFL